MRADRHLALVDRGDILVEGQELLDLLDAETANTDGPGETERLRLDQACKYRLILLLCVASASH